MKTRGVPANSLLALLGDLAAKGGILAVTLVAARGLSTVQFALLASAIAIATILTALLDLGSQTLLTRDGVTGPADRGALLAALARARLPVLALVTGAAVALGAASGHVAEALATVALAAAGAVQLSLTGALRSARDLRPEAIAKLAGAILTLGAAAVCVALAPRALTVLSALALANVLALGPMLGAARAVIARGPRRAARTTLWRAAPLGAMALATLAYYRSGTIALSLFSTPRQTAAFAAASTIAWGLLSVANAVTTGLLPRLASAEGHADRTAVTRRALIWTTVGCGVLAAVVALTAVPLLTILFGARYADGAGALALLAAATVLIAPAGVLGTALIAVGRVRPLAGQVAASLVVNLAALAAFARLGASGAALATLACEVVALLLLAGAAAREFPGLFAVPTATLPRRPAPGART